MFLRFYVENLMKIGKLLNKERGGTLSSVKTRKELNDSSFLVLK
ncbi:hypothetical protein CLV99_2452 [Sphingobacterium yanglingense]|uniref:Uncharacterized protein n=1 Tax=Sphingobacterium yanglingense TaxID=1437280 RepID=A0A4R6WFZ0_9SPHI|nr:hypothetical protein CLV99_2452 [Sphingobacterium yanglingense]